MREDTHIWVTSFLISKMNLPYRYSVGGYMYSVEEPLEGVLQS